MKAVKITIIELTRVIDEYIIVPLLLWGQTGIKGLAEKKNNLLNVNSFNLSVKHRFILIIINPTNDH